MTDFVMQNLALKSESITVH